MNKILFFIFAFIPSIAFAQITGGLDYDSTPGGGRASTDPVSFSPNGLIKSIADAKWTYESDDGTKGFTLDGSVLNTLSLRTVTNSTFIGIKTGFISTVNYLSLTGAGANGYLTFASGDDTTLYHGAGAPSAVLTPGSAYMRSDCDGSSYCLHVNTDGLATGWEGVRHSGMTTLEFGDYGSMDMLSDGKLGVRNKAGTSGFVLQPNGTAGVILREGDGITLGYITTAEVFANGAVAIKGAGTDGYIQFTDGADAYLIHGSGSPEGVITAPISSFYYDTSGGLGAPTSWSKVSGTGSTGWIPNMQGDMYIAGEVVDVSIDTTITIAAADTYYEVTSVNFATAAACGLLYWTNSNGGLTPDANAAFGKYNYIAPLSFSAGNGDVVEFIMKKGTTEIAHCHTKRTMSTTAFGSSMMHCPIGITDTSELTLWVKNSTTTDVVIGDATTWFVER